MWGSTLTAYLHYLGFMLAFGALVLEQFTLKKDLNQAEAWRILWADATYGISAIMILVTGILRVLFFGQGADYYLHNAVFYAKVGLFLGISVLSLYPTFSFLSWIPTLQRDQLPNLELAKLHRLTWLIRAELMGFVLIPLLAAAMARGIGFPFDSTGLLKLIELNPFNHSAVIYF